MKEPEITDEDRAEIGNQIIEGFTSGALDGEGYRVSWEIKMDKFSVGELSTSGDGEDGDKTV